MNAWDGYADAREACEPLRTIPNGPNHTNALQHNSSSVPYIHTDPERALLFPNANSVGIFHETCHHEKSPFLGTELHGPGRDLRSTIAVCSRRSVLKALYACSITSESCIIKQTRVRGTLLRRPHKARSVGDGPYLTSHRHSYDSQEINALNLLSGFYGCFICLNLNLMWNTFLKLSRTLNSDEHLLPHRSE